VNFKSRIKTLNALKSTLHVWEVLAINRYKKYSAVVSSRMSYFLRLQEILEHLYSLSVIHGEDLLELRTEEKIDTLLLTTDRGYVGDLILRIIKTYNEFVNSKKGKEVHLFVAGSRGIRKDLPIEKSFERIFGKDLDWDQIKEVTSFLVKRFRKGESDACYVIFHRPEVLPAKGVELKEKKKEKTEITESPFFYTDFSKAFTKGSHAVVERGSYRPLVIRFLPPDIRKRYSPKLILNIEADERELIKTLLNLYVQFFMREIFIEHFTSINFARYRTIRRILENIDKKIDTYRKLHNKLRQEKINSEIEDIVLSHTAQEDIRLRDFVERGFTLSVDYFLANSDLKKLKIYLENQGFPIRSIERINLTAGFRLTSVDKMLDLSVEGKLKALDNYVRKFNCVLLKLSPAMDIKPDVLEKWDKEYFWHPFTQMKVYREEDNIIFEKGHGVYLWDIYGNKYIDAISSLWCNVHGHNHPKLNKALEEQLKKVAHTTTLGSSNVPAILLAKKLVDISPAGLTKVFYSEDGAEAVEIALKMAYHYWKNKGEKRKVFITFSEAYHGDTLGAVAVGGIKLFHGTYEDLIFKTLKLPSPYLFCKSSTENELLSLLENLLKEREDVIAVVLESGIQAAAGMLPYPKGFMKKVRDITSKYGVLMIVDEVATGFGRTGTMFYCEQEGITPDFMCLGKGLTGGYLPLAATLTTEEIFEAFLGEFGEAKHFYHGHTYTGNNLACAVALANLEVFEEEKTLDSLKPKIELLTERLREFQSLKHVGDVRQLGFMAGIEIVKDKEKGEPFPYGQRTGFKIARLCRDKGVFLRPLGDVMVLMMPLVIKEDEINFVLDTLYWAIANFTSV